MSRKAKFTDISDRWMNDSKWKYEKPFMIGPYLCFETVKGSGKTAVFEHHMIDTTGLTVNHLICQMIPKEAIEMYKFLNNID